MNISMYQIFKKVVEKQIIQEYRKNGVVKNKVILLAIDEDDTISFCHKDLPKNDGINDDEFFDKFVKTQKIIDKLVVKVSEDGYRVKSMVVIDYHESDTDDYISLSFKSGKGFQNVVNKNYYIEKTPTMISDDGVMMVSQPKLVEVME